MSLAEQVLDKLAKDLHYENWEDLVKQGRSFDNTVLKRWVVLALEAKQEKLEKDNKDLRKALRALIDQSRQAIQRIALKEY